MSNAVMPLAHYKETCDVIRKKTGSTNTIKSGEMPDKINDVFRAGQFDIVSSAEALKGFASGSLVALNDVSPVEHNVKCLVSSDTITDLSAVKVNRYGKNLLDTSNVINAQWAKLKCETVENGYIKINGTKYGSAISTIKTFENPITLPKGTYTISLNHISGTLDIETVGFYLTIGGTDYISGGVNGRETFTNNRTITLAEDAQLTNIKLTAYQDNAVFTDFTVALQLEKGSTATGYEPYSCTEYTANSDGTVEGIKSLYPNMTLLTDTEGVIVTAEYIKDIDKAFEERLAEIEKALVNN